LRAVAVAAIFSPLDPSHEERAGQILAEECPGVAVTLSHRLGRNRPPRARERRPAQRRAGRSRARHDRRVSRMPSPPAISTRRSTSTQNDGTVIRPTPDRVAGHEFRVGRDQFDARRRSCPAFKTRWSSNVGGHSTEWSGQLRRGFPREANSVVGSASCAPLPHAPMCFRSGSAAAASVTAGGA